MDTREGWHLITVAGRERCGWFGTSTRAAAEAWFERESDGPYRPTFYMVGESTGRVIGRRRRD